MKESRKEFIKKAHSEACNEWKKNIEKEFPKLFKNDDLVVGKWYKYRCSQEFLMVWNNSEDTYGFWGNEYRDDLSFHISSDKIPATDQEVEEALIKESKRRGFKKGVKFIDVCDGFEEIVDGDNYKYYPKENRLTLSYDRIFDNGKWAEIITKTITKEQAEKELGKTILN